MFNRLKIRLLPPILPLATKLEPGRDLWVLIIVCVPVIPLCQSKFSICRSASYRFKKKPVLLLHSVIIGVPSQHSIQQPTLY